MLIGPLKGAGPTNLTPAVVATPQATPPARPRKRHPSPVDVDTTPDMFQDSSPAQVPSMLFTEFYRVYWVLLGVIGFYWVLLGFTGVYWVLLGFTEYVGTPDQYRLLFTEFYWALLGFIGFTGFYWVLLGFTEYVGTPDQCRLERRTFQNRRRGSRPAPSGCCR